MNKPERIHTGEQIHFPHLAKNERDMGHGGWVRVLRPVHSSLNLASAKSFDRDNKAEAVQRPFSMENQLQKP
jgi:hypothetical protein